MYFGHGCRFTKIFSAPIAEEISKDARRQPKPALLMELFEGLKNEMFFSYFKHEWNQFKS